MGLFGRKEFSLGDPPVREMLVMAVRDLNCSAVTGLHQMVVTRTGAAPTWDWWIGLCERAEESAITKAPGLESSSPTLPMSSHGAISERRITRDSAPCGPGSNAQSRDEGSLKLRTNAGEDAAERRFTAERWCPGVGGS